MEEIVKQLWLKKVDTSWAPVGGNRNAYFLRREITCGLAQWKRICCSSWTLSVSHRYHNYKLQSTLQPAAEVLTFLEASAIECQLELSCHNLRCMNFPFYTWSLVSAWV
jgi:hypothetical protein